MNRPAMPVQPPQQLPEKWIARLDGHASVADAAQHVLDRRVGSTASILKALAKSKAESDEHVHQLRVATRRAQSALLSFKPWLRRERRRAVNRSLRRVRTAAGVVRMCDVHRGLLMTLTVESTGEQRLALEAALMMLRHDRQLAMGALFRLSNRDSIRRTLGERGGRWFRRLDEMRPHGALTEPERPPPTASVHVAGEVALRNLAIKVCEASLTDLSARERLHSLRLCCKRLRYAIEIFGATSCHVRTLIPLSATLVEIQERLGEVNDAHEVAERLARYAAALDANLDETSPQSGMVHSKLAPAFERFADRFETRCAQLAASFHEWWRGDEARNFRDALARVIAESAPAAEPDPVEIVVLPNRHSVTATSPTDQQKPDGED